MQIHNPVEVERAWLSGSNLYCCKLKIVKGIPNILKFPIWTVVTNAIPITFRQKKKKSSINLTVQCSYWFHTAVVLQDCRNRGTVGDIAPPYIFDRSANPISTRVGSDYVHEITTHSPLGFSNLPTALCWYNTIILHIEQF